ncbi:survival protein sure-like phosphatase/nucleotidase [Collybia nuda]|uniref:Survival protein sure-like phosphatase/nucleotidase n=1 Tax=Collybia nuda TaxID=64659 RepID=A0A9P6CGE4_9AGAR|nr:survival protein sure-like phosphatase/nucleotidase [Collybia nuda]
MSTSPMSKPRVLLTNDDGPPNPLESPYILGLYKVLTQQLGWDVKVVIPSSQKSWIGKAFHIKEITTGSYFYPKEDGQGEISNVPRILREGEIAEWILLDGTPATCANVGLHNIFPGQIDLVISGPNLGRNTSAAFSLSSGTIGAALSSSLSKFRSIAISYGTILHPTPQDLFEPAHKLTGGIIQYLWYNWGVDEGGPRAREIDLYSVNIPLIQELLSDDGLTICWTTIWRNSYGQLFKQVVSSPKLKQKTSINQIAGPDVLSSNVDSSVPDHGEATQLHGLAFKFSPNMSDIINPSLSTLPVGSDGWAIQKGWVSVTPLRASYGEPTQEKAGDITDKIWKMRL